MEDTSKYLIHADVTADGVVERSDVVGAIFGQTEGLLGDDLDLRDLRQSGKVGRIDVEITSTGGQSHGQVTIATSLDKVETATLAAAFETISRVGPCRAALEIREIEDVRAAKRKEVVDRAKELLRTGFDDTIMSSDEILAEVRQQVRVEDITEYEGLPAGPRVTDSDAIIVVEGRADVLTLLKYGIKNAIAVEGTNVPDAVAELTRHRTVTAFLDGDRGGDLILEELAQVGDIDYVAFAPAEGSVEDLDHHELFAALRNKVPYDTVAELNEPREAVAATDGSATPSPPPTDAGPNATDRRETTATTETGAGDGATAADADPTQPAKAKTERTATTRSADKSGPNRTGAESSPASGGDRTAADEAESDDDRSPETVYGHAAAVVRAETDRVRFLDGDGETIDEVHTGDAYDALEDLEPVPTTVVLDDALGQRLLDLAADRGVDRIVARSLGQFTKRPTAVRIHAIDEIAERPPETNKSH
ncbi:DNA primase DnaG [Natrinema thermotolerans]|uniref:DNA primase DnaG n=1 Tax=Natrinema thermotolerans TaxID=121872 RepID=A0AAF0PC03_9EURY|nr:DNA primase DnaG [Natrinema thermotolerans]QCC59335.1 DNA primase [Natrinema thermotolerans]WMT06305.1 DNA primase DnaG [Natrinema thermotolerans]